MKIMPSSRPATASHHRDLRSGNRHVVSDDGRNGTYKREGNILKISGDQSLTLTIQGNIPEPPTADFTAPYTSSIGTTGTMTIVSVG
jgi:hypothetical protein